MTEAADLSPINVMILEVILGVSSIIGELFWRRIIQGMNYAKDELSYGMKLPRGFKSFRDRDEFSGDESILEVNYLKIYIHAEREQLKFRIELLRLRFTYNGLFHNVS